MNKQQDQALRERNAELERELEIEAALERVRTVAMGMRTPDDLLGICKILFEELTALGFIDLRNTMINIVNDEKDSFLNYDFNDGNSSVTQFSHNSHLVIERQVAMTRGASDAFIEHILTGDDLKDFKAFRIKNGEAADPKLENIDALYYYFYSIGDGSVGLFSFSSLTGEKREVLKRFRNVFDLVYRRYVDIKQAEEQARESQVQLALERVRARTSAMQKSDELAETVSVLFKQLLGLGIPTELIRTCGIVTFDNNKPIGEQWITDLHGDVIARSFMVPYDEAPAYRTIYKWWKEGKEFEVVHLEGNALQEHLRYLAKYTKVPSTVLSEVSPEINNHVLFFSQGCLFIITRGAVTGYHEIFQRFGSVFRQSYTRFLDLKQAEAQSREAQIETALERVRSRSMGMQKSDELKEVIQIIYEQFVHLNINIDHTGFVVDYKAGDDWHFWVADQLGSPAKLTVANYDCEWNNRFDEAKEKGIDFFATNLDFEKKNKFYRDLFNHAPGIPEQEMALIFSKPALAISTVLLDDVALYIESYAGTPYTDEENATLMRFGKVFQQTYTRFLDLQKAEGQAREAQIEASLERVRSRAMAMHKTDELLDAAELLYRELTNLGIESMAVTYSLMDDAEKNAFYYSINPVDGKINPKFFDLPHDETDVMRSILSSWKKKETVNMIALDEEATLKHQTYIAEKLQTFLAGGNINMTFSVEAFLAASPKKAVIYTFNFAQGYIFIIGGKHLTAEQEEMVLRFTKVFELTYRRFLDIKQAEEQARESQIQLALERIRARTMAMQTTDELSHVIQTIFNQFIHLGVSASSAGFIIDYKETDDQNIWATAAGLEHAFFFYMPYTDIRIFNLFVDAKKRGLDFYSVKLTKEEKDELYRHVFKYLPVGSEEVRQMIFDAPGYADSHVLTKDVVLYILNYTGVPFSDEENNILIRFGNAFQQTYTRFSDLKKAEEQARESQIQLALERIRARTMAMQQSDELADISLELFKQIQSLGVPTWHCAFRIYNEEEQDSLTEWSTNVGGVYPRYQIPNEGIFRKYHDAGMAGETLHVEVFDEERCAAHYAWLCTLPGVGDKLLALKAHGMSFPTSQVEHVAFFKHGYLIFVTYEPAPRAHGIFKRFAKVFEQTYTRFLDLQNAEDQVRESQIQLALERIRARTMAMQKSDELAETVYILFQQFKELGENPDQATIGVINEEEHVIEYWVTMHGEQTNRVFKFSINEPHVTHKIYKAWKAKKNSLVIDLAGKALLEFMKYRAAMGGAKVNKVEKRRIINVAFFSKGLINVQSTEERSEESIRLLERFAGVFDGTYTRFLDLKQAEAQAREAQIQLALERVRARTSAMQKSEELHEVIQLVFDQLRQLNFDIDNANFSLNYKETSDFNLWIAVAGARYATKINVPYFKHPAFDPFNKAKGKGGLYTDILSFEEKNSFFRHFFKYAPQVAEERKTVIFDRPGYARSTVFMKNTALTIVNYNGIRYSEIENNVLLRFGQVFDQTYTRFSDLKQAEELAREGQIQLALERVRARTMAMQKSEELSETATVLFQQLHSLDIAPERIFISIPREESRIIDIWGTEPGGKQMSRRFEADADATWAFRQVTKGWEEGKPEATVVLKGKHLEEHVNHVTNIMHIPFRKELAQGQRILHSTYFSRGFFVTIAPDVLQEETRNILQRFGGVFDQTYTRFLDLKKAEEQAREGQIQLALERVRARTMAMQRSDELAETAGVLFQQLHNLGIIPERVFVGIPIEGTRKIDLWGTEQGGTEMTTRFEADMDATHAFRQLFKALEDNAPEAEVILKGKDLAEHINYVANVLDMPLRMELVQGQRVLYGTHFSKGWLVTVIPDILPRETLNILQRFAAVFDQTYTRFLDLERAEAQAREGQIQLGLERVRAKAMSMQNSDELNALVGTVFEELTKLDFVLARCLIMIFDPETLASRWWMANSEVPEKPANYLVQNHNNPAYLAYLKAWHERILQWQYVLKGKVKRDWDDFLFVDTELSGLPGVVIEGMKAPEGVLLTSSFNNFGCLTLVSMKPLSDEHTDILLRFANVFDMSYTRFNDLKQAEAQAREGQIQLGLERVRARAMAMQTSEELNALVGTVFEELTKLDFVLTRCMIMIFDPETLDSRWWMVNSEATAEPVNFFVPNNNNTPYQAYLGAWRERALVWHYELKGKVKRDWDEYLFADTELSRLPQAVIEGMKVPEKVFWTASFNNFGCLRLVSMKPLSDEHTDILLRFAKVFDMSYTRFNDLKQAEAQARDGRIQLGLERVRAAAMAMHGSAGVSDATALVFTELYKLGINTIRCGVCIVDGASKEIEVWSASQEEGKISRGIGKLDMTSHPLWVYLLNAWKEQESSFVYELKGKELADYYHIIRNAAGYQAQDNKAMYNQVAGIENETQYCNCYLFKEGCLFTFTHEPFSLETGQVIEKFAAVFGLTYRRYLDLTKAEAQVREAQIEAALERVRSKTMAMHNSGDVADTAAVMFDELVKLGVEKTVRCGIGVLTRSNSQIEVWTAKAGENEKPELIIGHFDTNIHPLLKGLYDAWHKHEQSFSYVLADEDRIKYYESINNQSDYPIKYDVSILPSPQYNSDFFFAEGVLYVFTSEPLSDEISSVFKRFAGVFGQTYRRYLDLQKAEAQVREAQIEAALERVRSKTMAMHNSADVGETVTLMFNELVKLGVDKIARCGIAIPDNKGLIELWTAKLSKDEKEEVIIGHIDTSIHPMLALLFDAWKSKQANFEYILEGDDLTSYIKAINNSSGYPIKYDVGAWGTKQYHNDFFFPEGMVFAFTFQPLNTEIAAIFKRFAGVFGQTYRRYLDLQKAENQAREAQIEAALERVRSKAMAMRSSNDLNATANTVFVELRKLGVDLVRCGLGLMQEETHISTIHAATNSAEGGNLEVLGNIDMNIHPVLAGIYGHWRQNEDYFPVLEGESLKTYYEKLRDSNIAIPEWESGEKQYGYFLRFANGSLYAWSGKQESEATIKTLKRFTSVIGLTYTRYIELEKAEINTKEAIKQASLDRVRAEIASMRKRSDLERITPLIWEELTVLGIPFIRCGVFIMDEEQKLIHTFLSTPDGKAIGAFHVPYNTPGNFMRIVNGWRKKDVYIDHWKESDFLLFADALFKQGAIASKENYMKMLPHDGVHLNFLPFLQGMLYVGNTAPLAGEKIDLIQSVADAFSTAYARYEDFNKLEAAKQQVDNTLTQLKATQNKLIQSEKMASLGELTAGIAHEIQNPLNFVNNFSEVSAELIDEMDEELDKGEIEEAKAIAIDIKQNLEKIRHHGGRADGIVKGMLQHSRASSDVKEPTDINKLADEYLRLAYHGLRAKDKEFNAELVTRFDDKLPKPEVVPQDIGRVLINLYNNAFYATQQKAKTADGTYKPEVTVATCKEDGQVIVRVKDNGNGIPAAIKDKIMQPFFTTKPTGEGTGLGLSLSYDIVVKGHGGTMSVNSIEGEGSEFTILIPILIRQ